MVLRKDSDPMFPKSVLMEAIKPGLVWLLLGFVCFYCNVDRDVILDFSVFFSILGVSTSATDWQSKTRLWNDLLCVEWDVKLYCYLWRYLCQLSKHKKRSLQLIGWWWMCKLVLLLQDSFILDLYLATHVEALYSQIRNRALCQVTWNHFSCSADHTVSVVCNCTEHSVRWLGITSLAVQTMLSV